MQYGRTMTEDRPGVGPFPLGDSPEWRWGAWGRVVDGAFWPWRLEVRLKSRPCHHDEPPAGWRIIECDESGAPLWATDDDWDSPDGQPATWNRSECNCWETLTSPATRDIPPGGLTARTLRKLRLGNVDELVVEAARNDQLWELSHGHDTKRRVDEVVAKAEVPRPGPGRLPMPRDEHLRRLAALEEGTQLGHKQERVARSLGLKISALRNTLRWARDEGLWQRSGRGVAMGPTPQGKAAIQEWRARQMKRGDHD